MGGAPVGRRVDAATSEGKRGATGAGAGAASLLPAEPTVGAAPNLKTGVVGAAAELVAVGLAPKPNAEEAAPDAGPKMVEEGLLVGAAGGGGGGGLAAEGGGAEGAAKREAAGAGAGERAAGSLGSMES
eukprot:scaffold14870_cov119-Isochrysis_galbana.AAC.7